MIVIWKIGIIIAKNEKQPLSREPSAVAARTGVPLKVGLGGAAAPGFRLPGQEGRVGALRAARTVLVESM